MHAWIPHREKVIFFMNINEQTVSKCHQGRLKFEINIPPQQIFAKSKGGLTIEGGIMLSEYNISVVFNPQPQLILVPSHELGVTWDSIESSNQMTEHVPSA